MKKTVVVSLLLSLFSLAFSILISLADPLALDSLPVEPAESTSGTSTDSPGIPPDAEYVL